MNAIDMPNPIPASFLTIRPFLVSGERFLLVFIVPRGQKHPWKKLTLSLRCSIN
jgi:hypothetical protein